jgi:hypothetical protein
LDSGDLALMPQKQIAAKKKGPRFWLALPTNSVTLRTRVRMEILKAVAKCFANEREVMYMTAFSSRPLLHVRQLETNSRAWSSHLQTGWITVETCRLG